MTITHFGLLEDYFKKSTRHRVFICEECGALLGNDFIEKHEEFHRSVRAGRNRRSA